MSDYTNAVSADSPLHWYRCADVSGNILDIGSSIKTFGSPGPCGSNPSQVFLYNQSGGQQALLSDADGCHQTIDYYSIVSSYGPINSRRVTLECWVRPDLDDFSPWTDYCVTAADRYGVFGFQENSTDYINIRIDKDGRIQVIKSGTTYQTATGVVIHDKWAHIVVVIDADYSGSDPRNFIDIYKNGARVHSTYGIPQMFQLVSGYGLFCTAKTAGSPNVDTTTVLRGFVDEFAIYSTALSATRIGVHYETAGYRAGFDILGVSDLTSYNIDLDVSSSDSISITEDAVRIDEESASDSVTVGEILTENNGPQVIDSISVTEAYSYTQDLTRSLSDDIVIAESVTRTVDISASDTISITDSAYDVNQISDSVSITDSAHPSSDQNVSDGLGITETLDAPEFRWASDVIPVGETVAFTQSYNVSDSVNISEVVIYSIISTRTPNDTVVISEVIKPTKEASVTDTIIVGEVLSRTEPETVTDSIVIAEILSSNALSPVTDSISVSDTASYTAITTWTASDTIEIEEVVFDTGVKQSDCTVTFSPSPALGTRTTFRLTYPYISPTLTLDLRNPKFNNAWITDLEHDVRRVTNGQLNVARRTKWPKIRNIKVSFEGLSKQQRDDWLTFVEQSSGDEIGLLDHENRQWKGIINSGVNEVIQTGIGCQYELSFEFRGNLVT